MELLDALRSRHSVRVYTGEPIDEDTIREVIEAAILAPSSFNAQPWCFHVALGEARKRVGEVMALSTQYLEEYVDRLEPEQLDRAAEFYADLGGAPVVIAASVALTGDEDTDCNALLATGAAIENLLLRATDLGLGACSITAPHWVVDRLREIFDISDDRKLAALVLLGRSAEVPLMTERRHDVVTFLK
ncbi:MAG: nitroreductase family protein [Actinomycetia bacterium]|nr:nitroreductase family protein [Actinomycetes bacterium]